MSKLPLAVEIADVVASADGAIDVQSTASALHQAFPEASVTEDDIADTLRSEGEAAGVQMQPRLTLADSPNSAPDD